MSYCRFSSMDGQSEAYCYYDRSGCFVTWVAANRLVFKSELPAPVPMFKPGALGVTREYIERAELVSRLTEEADRVPIGLPYDGQRFVDDSPLDAANRLESLQAMGYRVPQYAINNLRAEGAE